MKILTWVRGLWQKDSAKAAARKALAAAEATLAAAKALGNLTEEQVKVLAKEVEMVSREPIKGVEKASKVEAIVRSPVFQAAYQMPDWADKTVDVLSTVIKLVWLYMKFTGRIL